MVTGIPPPPHISAKSGGVERINFTKANVPQPLVAQGWPDQIINHARQSIQDVRTRLPGIDQPTYATHLEAFVARGDKHILVAIPHESQRISAQTYVEANVPPNKRASVNVQIAVMNAHSGQFQAGDTVPHNGIDYSIIPYCWSGNGGGGNK